MGNKHLLNKLPQIIIILILFGVAILSILLIIKPGASIFHIKQNVNIEEVKPHDGQAYRYPINLNSLIFPAEGGMLFEDGQLLERTYTAEVVKEGLGKYSLVDHEDGSYFLNFSASNNSNPLTNGKAYTLFFKVIFLSRPMGITMLGILILGLVWFLMFAYKSPVRRQALAASPSNIWLVLNDFLFQEIPRILTPITNPEMIINFRRRLWIDLITFSAGAAYFYVFMEWFFFVTKPSFMDLMSWFDKIEIFFVSSFTLAIISMALVIVLAGLDFLLSKIRINTLPIFLGTLIPSFILAAIFLLLVDNFTYTIFNFGIVSSVGIWRYAYGLGFLILFIYINSRILEALSLRGKPKPPLIIHRYGLTLIACLFIASAGFALTQYRIGSSENTKTISRVEDNNQAATRPNILIIGSDGLNASNLSVYGYERETTPALSELAKTSLVAENVFANASHSTGSVASILTGKPAAQTRVTHTTNILNGIDAYQHLPGILRNIGYHNVEIGVRKYVDAYNINMLDGFDTVNKRSFVESKPVRTARALGLGINAYFASGLVDRISDRLLHVFFIRKMENPYAIVTQPVGFQQDQDRLNQLVDLIKDTERPLFVHVHMIGTHGPLFSPEKQKFSVGKTQDEKWMTDFYDDSILAFDNYIGELVKALEENDKINNTILIIYTDHPMKYDIRLRIPLLIHFPNNQYAGQLKVNSQNLEIAPTILDYLGIQSPLWMEGQSLIEDAPQKNRLIFGTSTEPPVGLSENLIASILGKPPFYQFTYFIVIDCQKWHSLNLISMTWDSGIVAGHTNPCTEDSLLSMDQIKDALAEYLSTNGFDISTLP
jgi:glucan phosphoethanolaminetransferase (alkaline phosphatase superfamily)